MQPDNRSGPRRIRTSEGVLAVSEPGLKLDIKDLSGNAAVLELSGEIDMLTAPLVESAFRHMAERGLTDVIVDARDVGFMDSTGINALAQGRQIIFARGSSVSLVGSRPVRRVLDLVFPDNEIIVRFDTIEDAIANLGLDH